MNFAEIRFWGLLAAGLVVIVGVRFLLRPFLGNRGRQDLFDRAALMMLGMMLLSFVSWITVTIFLVVSVCSYLGLAWLLRHGRPWHRAFLCLLIPIQLLPLLYYKYANFALNQVLGFQFDTLRHLMIPVGISFYTFQMVAFVIDTLGYRHPLPRFLDFLNFAGFFPQIVAGPIERRGDLLPQMQQFRFRWSAEDIHAGLAWVVVGMFFKLCLADNVALQFHGRSSDNAYLIWIDNLLFGLRIYFDFAGYSLVAVGLGRCLGIRLTLNFRSPYCSTSIAEFWRRWHITLSQWFRDYVYVPLGGGRTQRWVLNIAVVFIVSGIWHGAGWNFILWGALHGAFLVVNRWLGPRVPLPRVVAWALTVGAALFAWLCFYEVQTPVLWAKLGTLCTPSAYGPAAMKEALALRSGSDLFTILCLLALCGVVWLAEWWSVRRLDDPYAWLRRPAVLAAMMVLTVFLAPGKNNAFIYFAF